MMQMLEAGGAKLLIDGERVADVDNPKGYYEWELIKQTGKKPEVLDTEGLDGRAIKCISMLLQQMPLKHNYKVIFMTRPIEGHRNETLHWLKSVPHMEFIEIDYPTLIRNPEPEISHLVEFLGADRLPNSAEMARVIDPALHRKKAQKPAR
jgi:hypothetical protein